MQITIDGQTFTVAEDGERFTAFDAKNNIIGITNDMQSATAICEQIAWRRRVDGKVDDSVDEKPIAVDEQLTKGAVVDEKQFTPCANCEYYKVFFTDQILTSGKFVEVGYCCVNPNQYTTVPDSYTCNRAKRRSK